MGGSEEKSECLLDHVVVRVHLPLSVAEDNRLCDSESVIEITESVKLPFLLLDGHKELLNTLQCQFITVKRGQRKEGGEK